MHSATGLPFSVAGLKLRTFLTQATAASSRRLKPLVAIRRELVTVPRGEMQASMVEMPSSLRISDALG